MMNPPNESVPAVFLDRDGTLMREVNYCADPKQVEIFPGVPEALQKLKQAGSESWSVLSAALAESRKAFDQANQAAWDALKGASPKS